MVEIRKLRKGEWPMLTPVFQSVFKDAEIPSPDHADIIGAFEDGKLQGFVVLEKAVFIWEFFSRSQENNGRFSRKLVKYVRDSIPERQAVGAAADQPRFWMLFKSLGMSEMPGKLFWRSRK